MTEDERADLEAKHKPEWQANAQLREEFLTFADYVAFKRADAAGRVKIMGQRP
jgi:hypothetical protein